MKGERAIPVMMRLRTDFLILFEALGWLFKGLFYSKDGGNALLKMLKGNATTKRLESS